MQTVASPQLVCPWAFPSSTTLIYLTVTLSTCAVMHYILGPCKVFDEMSKRRDFSFALFNFNNNLHSFFFCAILHLPSVIFLLHHCHSIFFHTHILENYQRHRNKLITVVTIYVEYFTLEKIQELHKFYKIHKLLV